MTRFAKRGLAAAAALFLAATTSQAGARACWGQTERRAIAVRVLQAELSIGALACGTPEAYAAFVDRQSEELRRHGGALAQFYARNYGDRTGERKLNALMTRLANEASSRKSQWPTGYCDFVAALTHRAASAPPGGLADFAANQPHARHAMGAQGCD